MTTVAVTGVSTPLGAAIVRRLDGDPDIERIVGLDHRPPAVWPHKLDVRIADVLSTDVPRLLEGVDAIVHLGTVPPGADRSTRLVTLVEGTRHLLQAASRVQASAFVQMSTAMAYGAHPDNPVPLTEEAPLRAEAGFPPGYHAMLAEQLVTAAATTRPGLRTVVLRPAPLLGQSDESPMLRHLEAPLIAMVSRHDPPLQFCDVDDLARAVHLAATDHSDMRGSYNVASDGWLTAAELARMLGRPRLHVPEAVAGVAADLLAAVDLLEAGTPWLRYLMHPWVVDTRKLHAHGWSATRSNRELIRSFVDAHRDVWRVGPVRLSRRRVALTALGMTAATWTTGVLIGWWLMRRWRRRE